MQQLYSTCNLESYILGFFCNCLHLKREDLQQEKMQLREWRTHSAFSAFKVIRAQMQQPIRVDWRGAEAEWRGKKVGYEQTREHELSWIRTWHFIQTTAAEIWIFWHILSDPFKEAALPVGHVLTTATPILGRNFIVIHFYAVSPGLLFNGSASM